MLLTMDVMHPSLCHLLDGAQWTVQDGPGSPHRSISFLLSQSVNPPPKATMMKHTAQATTVSVEDPVDPKRPQSS